MESSGPKIKKKFRIVGKLEQKLPHPDYTPMTLEEEVIYLVKEWYEIRGLPVPPEELESCKGIDAQERAEYERFTKQNTVKPAYGTPEFWKDWWARKKAKEAGETPSNATKPQKSSDPKSAK